MANQPRLATPGDWLTTGQAAQLLDVSAETVRRWIDGGLLDGFSEPREERRRYFVNRSAVLARINDRGDDRDSADFRRGLDQLRTEVEALAADSTSAALERDRYRAEAAALRGALLRMNSAVEYLEAAAEAHTAALREHREALSLLLTPHSPLEG